jgi:hypothetical protein
VTTSADKALWGAAGCTGNELLALGWAAAGLSYDEMALRIAGDDARRIRAYGACETRTLDEALRVGALRCERDVRRGAARVARYQLSLQTSREGAIR